MSVSPWDCPFCGRASAEEPALKRAPHTHYVEKTNDLKYAIYWIICWFCAAHGPKSGSVAEAIERWRYRADVKGAPPW